jgi:hypothetical protein
LKQREEPFDYSIVARTQVTAYAVEKEDAQKKFSKELMAFIERCVQQRYQWISDRAKNLAQTSTAVAKMDPQSTRYDENLRNASKKFPTATRTVLTNIRKRQMLAKSLPPARNIFQSTEALALRGSLPEVGDRHVPPSGRVAEGSPKQSSALPPLSLLPPLPEHASKPVLRSPPRKVSTEKSGAATERLLAWRDKIPIYVAASAPIYADDKPVVPFYNRPLYRSRIAALGHLRLSLPKLHVAPLFKTKEETGEVYQFEIGARPIIILDKTNEKRTHTPNPFNFLHRPK